MKKIFLFATVMLTMLSCSNAPTGDLEKDAKTVYEMLKNGDEQAADEFMYEASKVYNGDQMKELMIRVGNSL